MDNSDVESGLESDQTENANTTLRCDTPAPRGSVIKENEKTKSSHKFEGKEVNDNAKSVVTSLSQLRPRNVPSSIPRLMRFYPGDIVVRKERLGYNLRTWHPSFGTVLKPTAGTEMANSMDRGSSNEFHVHWDMNNRILMTKGAEVALVDRVLLRGQRVESYEGKVGTVVDYDVTASCLINGTNEVVEKIPLKRLKPISPYVRGLEIMYRGWVGVIGTIKRNVWFKLDYGMVFYIETVEGDGFSKTDPFWGLGVACPGMRTKLPATAFKRARWVGNHWKFLNRWLPLHHLHAYSYSTIIRTEVTSLEIRWLQQTPAALNASAYPQAPPPAILKPSDLSKLLIIGTPSFETIGINSVRKLKLLPQDDVVDLETWLQEFKSTFIDGVRPSQNPSRRPSATTALHSLLAETGDDETPVKILQRHNVVTVKWQDGLMEKVPAISLPMISPTADDGEFPMGLTVAPLQKDSSNGDKYGIVMESNDLAKARSRKVNIRWFIDGKDGGIHETSVFDIRPHPTYSMYHRGTIIFPRKSILTSFPSAVVIDVNLCNGKMVVIRANDMKREEVLPHQVIALGKRCHWSFFSRNWVIDDLVVPPYQLDLEFDPCKKMTDVNEQKLDVFSNEDTNNPAAPNVFPTLWDEAPFELLGFAPETHRYFKCASGDQFARDFARNVKAEIDFLKEPGNVPEGIWIRCYENRLDLISVLMVGPTKTPYDDGLFLFDVQLPSDFPSSRPSTHYVSYTLEIHPLLSFDGNVCVSSVPWEFPNTPESPAPRSYLGYFLSSLQTMIFTPNPYFAHPSKQIEEGTERGQIKARMYNQGVFVRVMDSAWNMLQKPHAPWEKCIRNHFATALPDKFYNMEKWLNSNTIIDDSEVFADDDAPSYPLLPVPDGMRCAIKSRMEMFKKLPNEVNSFQVPESSVKDTSDTTADSESFPVTQTKSEAARLLTPIAEITEPSSTSTFDANTKHSNQSVPSDGLDYSRSLDSMENVKQKKKSIQDSESEPEELELNQNSTEGTVTISDS